MMAACVLVAEIIDSTLPCKGLFCTQGAECKHTSSHHHCQAPSSTYAYAQRRSVLDIGVSTRDQHTVALAGISCLQCILPHPEVLHRSTQPAIITERRAPTSNACVSGAYRSTSALRRVTSTGLNWLSTLACNASFFSKRCCTQAHTQPSATQE